MNDRRVCPQCGTVYGDDLRFCPKDGTALRPVHDRSDLVGHVIAERYHVSRKLGEGGMGEVYLAEHVKMGRLCALKVIRKGLVNEADALARFTREAGNASRIAHPNVAAIYDFGETPDGVVFLAMEFVDGESLHALVKRDGPLNADRAVGIAGKVADALGDAHALGIVHRDLKPENIMIGRTRDGSDLVKVVDFGIAKAVEGQVERQTVTRTGFVVGTPDYMSPEQLAGEPLDGKSDQYALALVTFHMLTGSLPFPGKTQHESMVKRLTDRPMSLDEARRDYVWPRGLQAVFDRALSRHPDERFASVTDFAGALGACLRGEGAAPTAVGVGVGSDDVARLSGVVGFSDVVGRPAARGEARSASSERRALNAQEAAAAGWDANARRAPAPGTHVRTTRESRARHSGLLTGIMAGGVVALAAVGGTMILMGRDAGAPGADTSTPLGAGGSNDSTAAAREQAARGTAARSSGTPSAPTTPLVGAKGSSATQSGGQVTVFTEVTKAPLPSADIATGRHGGQPADSPRGNVVIPTGGRGDSTRVRLGTPVLGNIPRPTGNPALDSAVAAVKRGMSVVDSIARLDPQSFSGLRRPEPGARPGRGRDVPPPVNSMERTMRSRAGQRALEGIEDVIDGSIAGSVTELDLLRARQAVERVEREPLPPGEKLRARLDGAMLQALLTRSPGDCAILKGAEAPAGRVQAHYTRMKAVIGKACGN